MSRGKQCRLRVLYDVEANNPYHVLPSINQPTVYQAINRYFGLHSSPLVTVNAVVVVIIYLSTCIVIQERSNYHKPTFNLRNAQD